MRTSAANWPLTAALKSFNSTSCQVLPASVLTSTLSAPSAVPDAFVRMYGDCSNTVTDVGWSAFAATSLPSATFTLTDPTNDCRQAALPRSGLKSMVPLANVSAFQFGPRYGSATRPFSGELRISLSPQLWRGHALLSAQYHAAASN